jgi:hypothetical protein
MLSQRVGAKLHDVLLELADAFTVRVVAEAGFQYDVCHNNRTEDRIPFGSDKPAIRDDSVHTSGLDNRLQMIIAECGHTIIRRATPSSSISATAVASWS